MEKKKKTPTYFIEPDVIISNKHHTQNDFTAVPEPWLNQGYFHHTPVTPIQ